MNQGKKPFSLKALIQAKFPTGPVGPVADQFGPVSPVQLVQAPCSRGPVADQLNRGGPVGGITETFTLVMLKVLQYCR